MKRSTFGFIAALLPLCLFVAMIVFTFITEWGKTTPGSTFDLAMVLNVGVFFAVAVASGVVIGYRAAGGSIAPEIIADRLRMAAWLAFGVLAYFLSAYVGPANPIVQTTLYKIGHVTTLAWIGYWISRHSLGRISTGSTPQDRIGRALLLGAVIVAGSLGL